MSESGGNGIGVTGFIFSIIAVLIGWIPVVGWIIGGIFWLLGLIFSAVGIGKGKRVKRGLGLSIAGLVISLIGVVVIIVAIVGVGAGAASMLYDF